MPEILPTFDFDSIPEELAPSVKPAPRFVEKLPETKTCRNSGIAWLPVDDDAHPQVAGLLEIATVPRYTASSRVEYVVSEFPADVGRGFVLAKTSRGTDGDSSSYHVFAAKHRGNDSCTCKGNVYQGTCKHVDAIRALIENGWL